MNGSIFWIVIKIFRLIFHQTNSVWFQISNENEFIIIKIQIFSFYLKKKKSQFFRVSIFRTSGGNILNYRSREFFPILVRKTKRNLSDCIYHIYRLILITKRNCYGKYNCGLYLPYLPIYLEQTPNGIPPFGGSPLPINRKNDKYNQRWFRLISSTRILDLICFCL